MIKIIFPKFIFSLKYKNHLIYFATIFNLLISFKNLRHSSIHNHFILNYFIIFLLKVLFASSVNLGLYFSLPLYFNHLNYLNLSFEYFPLRLYQFYSLLVHPFAPKNFLHHSMSMNSENLVF